MKTCTKCKTLKTIENFSISRKEKTHTWCRLCFREHNRKVYSENPERRKRVRSTNAKRIIIIQDFLWHYLIDHPCSCGESDPIVLEFDHRDPKTKIRNVSEMVQRGVGFEKIKCEIAKCDVMCANCHRRKTAKDYNYYKTTKSQLTPKST